MKPIKLSENNTIQELRDLDSQEIYSSTSKYLKLLKEATSIIKKNNVDLLHLTTDERQALGFGTWSKESGEYMLIPLYFSKLLPKETLVICPLFENSAPKPICKADDDNRAGCIAYQLYNQKKALNENN